MVGEDMETMTLDKSLKKTFVKWRRETRWSLEEKMWGSRDFS